MDRAIDPLQTIDAKLWADEFMATKQRLGDAEFDHAMMLGWFANAIMRGYDEGKRLGAADAQATIAALQARVQELEEWVQDQSTANLETMRHTDEMQSRALEAEQQLTQRTAELERVRGERDEYAHKTKMLCLQNGPLMIENHDMKKLIAALPKVEGEITVSADPDGWYVMPLLIRCVTKEQADGIAALLQERQKLC